MKIKQFFKRKKKAVVIGIVAVCLAAAGGSEYYLSQKKDNSNTNTQTAQEKQVETNLDNKEASQKNQNDQNTNSSQTTTSLGSIANVSIQATKSSDGSISLNLYGPQGNYDVEKCSSYQNNRCSTAWIQITSNENYVGHGGLSIGTMGSNEIKATFLVYFVENGKRTSVSKPLTVDSSKFQDMTTVTGA